MYIHSLTKLNSTGEISINQDIINECKIIVTHDDNAHKESNNQCKLKENDQNIKNEDDLIYLDKNNDDDKNSIYQTHLENDLPTTLN